MLNAKSFANAAAVVMAVWVVICTFVSYLAPNLLFTVTQSWMHTINLDVIKTTFNPNLGSIILGLVSASVLSWISVYATIWLYNRWSKMN